MTCKKCGSIVDSGTIFCPNCGANTNIDNNLNSNQDNYSPSNAQLNTANISSNYSKPRTTFLLVTTLMLVVLFFTRSLSVINNSSKDFESYKYLSEVSGYGSSYKAIFDCINVAVLFTVLSLIFSIIIFILIALIRYKISKNMPYRNSVTVLIVLVSISLVLYSIYAISAFSINTALENFCQIKGVNYHLHSKVFLGDLVACFFFIAFSIVNLIKSIILKSSINSGVASNSFNNNQNNYSKRTSTFIFVTTLIILVLICSQTVSFINSYNAYYDFKVYDYPVDNYLEKIRDALNILALFAAVSLISSIIIFVIIDNIRDKINSNTTYKNKCNALFIVAIINAVLYLIYVLSRFNLYMALIDFVNLHPVDVFTYIFFIALSIINLIKSIKLKFCSEDIVRANESNNITVNLNNDSYNNAPINAVSIKSNQLMISTGSIIYSTLTITLFFCSRIVTLTDSYFHYNRIDSSFGYYDSILKSISFTILFTVLSLIFSIIAFATIVYIRNKINKIARINRNINAFITVAFVNIALYLVFTVATFQQHQAIHSTSTNSKTTFLHSSAFALEMLLCLTFIGITLVNLIKAIKLKKAQFI